MTTQLVDSSTRRVGTSWRSAGRHVMLLIVSGLALYPLVWLLGSSFKPIGEIFTSASPLPSQFWPRNYPDGWNSAAGNFGVAILNSVTICLLAVVGNMVSCSMAAYAFARLRFPGRRTAFAAMLVTIMLPSQVILIPQYVLFYRLGWVGTFLPLVGPKFLAVDAFFVFLMVQFIRSIPRELDEAATVDGCSRTKTFLYIILPLMKAPLITTAVLTFIWTYDDFFAQLIYLSDPSKRTVPVTLASFLDNLSGNSSYGAMFAMAVVAIVPVLTIYAVAQRHIVEGIATTGLKG